MIAPVLAIFSRQPCSDGWSRPLSPGEKRGDTRAAIDALEGIVALHDRIIPGLRSRIDHVAVGSDAVWVIDSRRYAGEAVKADGSRLWVGGLDATPLVDAAVRRAGIVRVAASAVLGSAPVRPVLCFEDADGLALDGPQVVGPVTVASPSDLAALIGRHGPVGWDRRAGREGPISDRAARRIAAVIGHRFPGLQVH